MPSDKVVFMGTPLFAKEVLAYLVSNKINIVAVVTTPDKPSGRGQKLHTSAVKDYALEKKIPVLQPEKLKSDAFIDKLKSIQADLFVVVAFRMLPEVVWGMPLLGTINLHASLLPQYRGAAPINWAIINGETQTGVTTFFIETKIDTGEIIDAKTVSITENMNVGELHNQLLKIGSELVLATVTNLFKGNVKAKTQAILPANELKSAPKIFKQDCQLDWCQKAKNVHNKIRGLSPYPTAWSTIQLNNTNKTIKFFKSTLTTTLCNSAPGTIKVEQYEIFVATQDYWIKIEELQLEGKKRMDTRAFCLGINIENARFDTK